MAEGDVEGLVEGVVLFALVQVLSKLEQATSVILKRVTLPVAVMSPLLHVKVTEKRVGEMGEATPLLVMQKGLPKHWALVMLVGVALSNMTQVQGIPEQSVLLKQLVIENPPPKAASLSRLLMKLQF